MLGLALEGGGAKGAYHMGVVKAFLEEGYKFSGITGTSIGALNGAAIAQGNFENVYQLWMNINPNQIFHIYDIMQNKLANKRFNKKNIILLASEAKRIIKHKGIDTSKMRKIVERIIDEEKLRESDIDFGLVAVSLSDFKPVELYKEDIPKGKIIDYLIASACVPGFEPQKIEDKYYIDGGLYDNCPINLLAQRGYKEIIAVRTLTIGVVQNIKYKDIKVTSIIPSENIGTILNFDNKLIHKNIQMGYYDAMRYIKGLSGHRYYFYNDILSEDDLFYKLASISDDAIYELSKVYGIKEMCPKRALFEKIIPKIADILGLSSSAAYKDIIIELFETIAEEKEIQKYKIYNFPEFLQIIKQISTTENLSSYEEGIKLLGIYPKKYKLLRAAKDICSILET